jgi:hypothetical protein
MARDDVDLITNATDRLAGRLEGLTDDEYLWEPVPDCWSVRPAADSSWRADLSAKGTTFTRKSPAPFTTIAWRLWHLGASPTPTQPSGQTSGIEFISAWFSQIPPTRSPAVGTADEARSLLAATWRNMAETVASFNDEELGQTIGAEGGPYGDATLESLVLHIADELIHHGAEVGVVRDLYAHRP